jgi:hypothetical protein
MTVKKWKSCFKSGFPKMVTIKTKHGEFKYKDWQWNLAWLWVFLCGVAVGWNYR